MISTDVSFQNGVMILGFVRNHHSFSILSSSSNTVDAEKQAVLIADALYPGEQISTDCEDALILPNVRLVNNYSNKEAHKTAKLAVNLYNATRNPNAPSNHILDHIGRDMFLERACKARINAKPRSYPTSEAHRRTFASATAINREGRRH